MPPFTVDLDALRAALSDHSLADVGDKPLQTKINSSVAFDELVLKPSAQLSVRVLNAAKDKDADAVFGDDDTSHVPFAVQSAWVKYTLDATVSVKVGFANASAGASRDVALSDYRIHARTDSAWRALAADLTSPRTLLDLDDVKKLQPGEALSMELGGALTASVRFSWSDVLATKLLDVVSELPVALKLKSGAAVSATVKVTDHFSVVISRTPAGRFRFAVKKAASRSHDYGFDVSLGLDAAADASEVADELLEQLPPEVAAKLSGTLSKKLEAAAKWKATAGFEYEYARIDENTSIADFILLDDARVGDDYALVMDGDFAKIAATLRQDSGARELVKYLNQSTLTRKSSFGFTLGLGKWALKTSDSSVFRRTTRTSLDGFRLITCIGTRAYEEKNVPQNDFEWTVDLKAQMREFLSAPTSRDFDYGLHLLARLERGAIGEGDVARMLDFAAMWNVRVPSASVFAEAVGKKGTLRVQLLFEREALTAALAQQTDLDSWAAPLAMAMPYMSTFPERRTFGARRDTYSSAWRTWLESGVTPPIDVQSGLSIFERQRGPGSFAWTAEEGHAQLRTRLESFVRGTRLLHQAMTSAQPPAAIGDAYDALSQFWSQRLYVAAAGRWLVERSNVRGTLQVEYGETTLTV